MAKGRIARGLKARRAGFKRRIGRPAVGSPAAWLVAGAMILAASAAMPLLTAVAGEPLPAFITLYPAVVAAALAGGPRTGLAAAVAALLIAWWFFLPQHGSLSFAGRGEAISLATFLATSLLLGWTVGRARLVIDAARASEARRGEAARESVHRIKNLLAVVQAISSKVYREADTKERYRELLTHRLAALSVAQDVLVREDWQDASLDAVVESALAPFLPNPGLTVQRGPEAVVPADHVRELCMALYELSTNAMKYGALAEGRGPVVLSWRVEGGEVVLDWDEETTVGAQADDSFGTHLIRAAFAGDPKASVRYELGSTGVRARFRWPAGTPQAHRAAACPTRGNGQREPAV